MRFCFVLAVVAAAQCKPAIAQTWYWCELRPVHIILTSQRAQYLGEL